jgi:LysR family transcriptional regulator (chromosome initiation inhibitor)
MMDVAFEQLATLIALDEEGTFEAAARRLHVTPSAVSQRVRATELSAGQVLVQRTNPVVMTAAGATMLRYARQVQLLERDAEHELQFDSDAGPLSIGIAINADSLNTWFLRALAPLVVSPGIVFDLHREDQDYTASLLRAGVVVAAVSSAAEPVQGCSSTPLGIMRYRAVCSSDFATRWAIKGDRHAALATAPVVLFDRNDELQHRFHQTAIGEPLTGPRHYIPTSADFASAVRLGFGWGLLPEQQCADGIRSGSLVELAAEHPIDVPLYWQRWNLDSRLLDSVSDGVVGHARTSLRQGPLAGLSSGGNPARLDLVHEVAE